MYLASLDHMVSMKHRQTQDSRDFSILMCMVKSTTPSLQGDARYWALQKFIRCVCDLIVSFAASACTKLGTSHSLHSMMADMSSKMGQYQKQELMLLDMVSLCSLF